MLNPRKRGGPGKGDDSASAFHTPPEFSSRSGASDEDEEEDVEVRGFATPGPGDAEDVQMLTEQQGAAQADPVLLEAKRAIEEHLSRQSAQAAAEGALSVESFADGGNIQGVSIGEGIPDGVGGVSSSLTAPGQAALTVYVAEPTSVDQVKAVVVNSLGIHSFSDDDVPVNVVVTGVIEAQPHRFRMRPAPGGVSISHFRVTAGTLGCLATGRTAPRNSRVLLLSNNHVIANSNSAQYGDCICQPGTYDGGRCPADQIAILERFVPIVFGGGTNYVDCATGWCWPDRVRRELVYLRNGVPQFFRISPIVANPALGMIVGKSGRTTQLTSGRITGVGATINVNYGGGRIATFRDQIAIQGLSGLFSSGGDSGSSIWTWAAPHYPVGLLFAGGGGVTFANRMSRVIAALDINLYT